MFIFILGKILFFYDIETIIIIFSIFSGIFYVLSYFYFVLFYTNNIKLSLIISIIVPTWNSSIQLNNGLYAQNIGISIMLLWFAYYFGEYSPLIQTNNIKNFLINISLLIFLYGTHLYTGIIFSIIFIIYTNIIEKQQYIKHKQFIKITYIFLFLLYIIFFSYIIIIKPIHLISLIDPLYININFNSLIQSTLKDTIFLKIIILFTPIILFILSKLNFIHLIISWLSTISIFSLFSGYSRLHRFLKYEPVPILTGLIIYYLFKNNKKIKIKFFKIHTININNYLIVAFILLQIFYSLPNSFIQDEISRPNNFVMHDIKFIRQHFGFSNNSLGIYINSNNFVDYEWAIALLGDPIYLGEQFKKYSQMREIDIQTRIPGAKYIGSIYNLTQFSKASYLILPNSTLNYNLLSDFDKEIIDKTSYIVENVYILDMTKIQEIIIDK
jgi:hypothetical protein